MLFFTIMMLLLLALITITSKRCGFEILLETSAETRAREVTPRSAR